MRLKSLELCGFKSFAEKTEFAFGRGITALVGPNGCGKSNVVDAFKWVLGEQKPRSLRSSEMLDVIYNGGADRTCEFAEATLVFENDRQLLPVEYGEVAVTRRLYRSGESEYLLNRAPVRLRDIRELLMGTGLGVDSYFIMEQGKIEKILNSSPEDRRALFDEAAGISLFKARKKEALRKLTHVSENLVRLNDILEEVSRQLHSLRIQAGKARRYQELLAAWRELRLRSALVRFRVLKAEEGEIGALRAAAAATRDAIALRDETLRESGRVAEEGLRAAEEEIAAAEKAFVQAESDERSARERRAMTERSIGETESEIAQKAADEDRLSDSVRTLEMEDESVRSSLAAAEAERARALDEKARLLAAEEEASSTLAAARERLTRAKSELVSSQEEKAAAQNRLIEVALQRKELQRRREGLDRRREEIRTAVDGVAKERGQLLGRDEALHSELSVRRDRLALRREALRGAEDRLRRATTDLQNEKERLSGLASRESVLEDLETRRVGLAEGVKALQDLASLPGGEGAPSRIVADVLTVDAAHALAIERALGERSQAFPCASTEEALRSIRTLVESKKGRAAFLPQDVEGAPGGPASPAEVPDAFGVVGRASDLVRSADPSIEHRIRRLLENVLVVRTPEDAALLLRHPSPLPPGMRPWRYVALDGTLFDPDGTVAGGSTSGGEGLLSQRSELSAVRREREAAEENVRQLESAARAVETECFGLRGEIEGAEKEVVAGEQARLALNSEIADRDRRLRAFSDERRVLDAELRHLEQEAAEKQEQEREATRRTEALAARVDDLRRELDALEKSSRESEERRDAARAALGQGDVVLVRAEEKFAGARSALDMVVRSLAEAKTGLDRARADRALLEARLERARGELQALFEAQSHAAALKDERRERVARAESGRAAARAAVAEVREAIERESESLAEVEKTLHELELRLSRCGMESDHLATRVREDLEIDIAERWAAEEAAPAAAPGIEGEADAGAPADPAALELEERELKQKLDRMGNVNLDALAELAELEKRESFLGGQRDDLRHSQDQLKGIIKRIETESRDLFERAFEVIRDHFREIFRKLFAGGSADLLLIPSPEGDDLDAGIEVVARPPGKEPATLALLSGGEKVMTTVALLFAIFKSRPSPFCLLDEVDAALDEANVQRFAQLLDEFLAYSQFILITHNKKTMSVADSIYGITMPEPGVSRRVSVKIREERVIPPLPADAAPPLRPPSLDIEQFAIPEVKPIDEAAWRSAPESLVNEGGPPALAGTPSGERPEAPAPAGAEPPDAEPAAVSAAPSRKRRRRAAGASGEPAAAELGSGPAEAAPSADAASGNGEAGATEATDDDPEGSPGLSAPAPAEP